MEVKKQKNQKVVFLYAFIITILVFNLGIYLGYKLESSRIDKINSFYLSSEIDILDQKVQEQAFSLLDLNCEDLIDSNIAFADKIFRDAQVIQKFEDANILNQDIIFQHKRFDLLRSLFWMNSVEIKRRCDADFHTVVYFYEYPNPKIEQRSEQDVFSNYLGELKAKYGDKIMLIPIAADKDVSSINLLLNHYNLDKVPVVMINEEVKLENIEELKEIESHLN